MMSEQFLRELRATRDRGLPISFDDVLAGAESVFAKTAGDERYIIACIEDVCRRRVAKNEADYDKLKEAGWPSTTAATVDKTLASARLQN